MTTDERKLEILRKVEEGTLSIEEGSELIGMLDRVEVQPQQSIPETENETTVKREASGCWKAAWSMILVGGAVLAGFSAYWMYQGYQNKGFGWGFWLSWIPMFIGVVLMIFGWALMESPWMHVNVRSKEQSHTSVIVFSMPVPFNVFRWVMQNFGHFMPEKVQAQDILEMIDQAEASIKRGEPFHVQVDDEKDGSKVDISIG